MITFSQLKNAFLKCEYHYKWYNIWGSQNNGGIIKMAIEKTVFTSGTITKAVEYLINN